MTRDRDRVARLVDAMARDGVDVLICASPSNVLLLSGYWPVVGNSLALMNRDAQITLLVPGDERDLAALAWADDVRVIGSDGLDRLQPTATHVQAALVAAATRFHAQGQLTVAADNNGGYEATTYAASYRYGCALGPIIAAAFPHADLRDASDMLMRQRAVVTLHELARIIAACSVAAAAFEAGAEQISAGLPEIEAAELFRAPLEVEALRREPGGRALGFAYCMAGAHSADAGGAYARSRAAPLGDGELALVHCNSCVDGYWTDITRTFALGEISDEQARMYAAIFAARDAALAVLRPGVSGRTADAAARDVLRQRGYGDYFSHGLGHGVGFAAIDHNARPRLHPASDDELQAGMVCNIEPAIYLPGRFGMRHCDMVHITENGAELLTPFLGTDEALTAGAARQGTIHA